MPGNIQKRRQQTPNGVCCLLVQAEGLEPPTDRLEGGHSVHLSYTRMWRKRQDSNLQAVSRVGFLDRCATNYALRFRVFVVGATGLEPATTRLKVGGSTN